MDLNPNHSQQIDLLIAAMSVHASVQSKDIFLDLKEISKQEVKEWTAAQMTAEMKKLGHSPKNTPPRFLGYIYDQYELFDFKYTFLLGRLKKKYPSIRELQQSALKLADDFLHNQYNSQGYTDICDFLSQDIIELEMSVNAVQKSGFRPHLF